MAARCSALVSSGVTEPLACSKEALAHVLKTIGWYKLGAIIGLAAGLALPSVVLMMLFGQTRIFFVMARDGLLPEKLAEVHPKWKTPYIVTAITGGVVAVGAAFFPVGKLADISNSGTLFAFMMVAIAVLGMRRTDPTRHRPFRTPMVWLFAPLVIVPLGMELGRVMGGTGPLEEIARRLQPLGAACAVAAMWLAPGRKAGLEAVRSACT